MGEHHRALFCDVFVEDNPILAAAKQRCQRSTARDEGLLSEILAVELQQIESVQKGNSGTSRAA